MVVLERFMPHARQHFSLANRPKHIAVVIEGDEEWARDSRRGLDMACERRFGVLMEVAQAGFRLNVPILTFDVLPHAMRNSAYFSHVVDGTVGFFERLVADFVHTNQVKVSVLGKWYDLPGRVVEPIRRALEVTRDYDRFFLNLCINYSGQEEIVDACKMIARQVVASRLDPNAVTSEMVKENLYSSYFMPPELIIKSGRRKSTNGLLLWDSSNAIVYFTDKPWPEFTKLDLMKAVDFYGKYR